MLIAGNLDVEVTWARVDAAMRRARGEVAPSPEDPRFALPEPVMRKISAAATLMRVAALNDEDTIWTPRPVDPTRMARIDWLPSPRLVSGPVPEAADVWWGQRTEAAAIVNHKAFLAGLDFARQIDSVVVRSMDVLEELAIGAGPWVAKAPYSAAGRLRVRGDGIVFDTPARGRAARLLEIYGCLVWDRWLTRTSDLGVALVRHASGGRRWERHDLLVGPTGNFLGITTPRRVWGRARDVQRETIRCEALGMLFGDALVRSGYQGEAAYDSFRYIGDDGEDELRRACEINARLTFGHLAHDLARRARTAIGIGAAEPVTLRFGRGVPPGGTIPLLLPGTDDDTSAWMEAPGRHAG